MTAVGLKPDVDPEPVAPDKTYDRTSDGTSDGTSVDGGAGAGRRLVLTPAALIEPAPVVWAWTHDGQGRIPAGALTVAAGREGTGKSSFGIWLAAHVTRGTLPGALHGRPACVLYVAVEDSWEYTMVPRLIAAGAALTRVFRVEVAIGETAAGTLSLPVDTRRLEQAVTEHRVALVVLDPLMSTIGAGIDTHREHNARAALDPLNQMAARTRCVVLGIAHFSKATGTDAATLITASGAFKNVPRAIFGFARDPDTSASVLTQVKNSTGRPEHELPSLSYAIEEAVVTTPTGPASVGRFVLLGTSERSVRDVLAGALSDDEDERRDAVGWLRAYLADNGGEAETRAVFKAGEQAGFSKDVLKRAKKRAGASARKTGMDAGWTWALPDDTQSPGHPAGPGAEGGDLAEGSAKRVNSASRRVPHPSPSSRSLRDGDPDPDLSNRPGASHPTSPPPAQRGAAA